MELNELVPLLQPVFGILWLLLGAWALHKRLWLVAAASGFMVAKAVLWLITGPILAVFVLQGLGLVLLLLAVFAFIGRKLAEEG